MAALDARGDAGGGARREDDAAVTTEADVSGLSRASPLFGGLALDLPRCPSRGLRGSTRTTARCSPGRRGARARCWRPNSPRGAPGGPPLQASRAVVTLTRGRSTTLPCTGASPSTPPPPEPPRLASSPRARVLGTGACAAAAEGGHLDVICGPSTTGAPSRGTPSAPSLPSAATGRPRLGARQRMSLGRGDAGERGGGGHLTCSDGRGPRGAVGRTDCRHREE